MGIEIEKKFTVKKLPEGLENCSFHMIEQGYLNVHPAIRVRKQDDSYYMTYKGTPGVAKDAADSIGQVEYNMPLDEAGYLNLLKKVEGVIITKKRYLIPLNDNAFDSGYLAEHEEVAEAVKKGEIKIEFDVFEGQFDGLLLAEVEFPSEDAAKNYHPADWFDKDVTGDRRYSNSQMSAGNGPC